LAFSRHFLSGEGNFIKHLARVGLKVCYKQEPIDEVDFTVSNLAIDLRDGVRLARMAEILTNVPRKSILNSLRLPSVSRLQKLHNVAVALQALRNFGVPISEDIFPYHVVDAHREIVLKLFWSVVAHCCLKKLVDAQRVKAEIRRIESLRQSRMARKNSEFTRSDEIPVEIDGVGDLQQLLLRWCHAVCSTFGVYVNNLTSDMADGKAVCLLIHYYHPNLLRLSEIRKTTRSLPNAANVTCAETLRRLHTNERANAALANTRMAVLGGIPKIVPDMDASSLPDERSMLFCLSFMCSRLLESKLEIRSCVLIQTRYRRYRKIVEGEQKRIAASVILRIWKDRRTSYYSAQRTKYVNAVRVIEQFALMHQQGLERRRNQSLDREALLSSTATLIQVTCDERIQCCSDLGH